MKQIKIIQPTSELSFSRLLLILIILIAIFGLLYLRRMTIERFRELHGEDTKTQFNIEFSNDSSQIEKVWEHQFPSGKVVAFWKHKSHSEQEYYPMGHAITVGDKLIDEESLLNKQSLQMVATGGKHPTGYQRLWNSKEMNPSPNQDLSIWKPIAPPGYIALGDVVYDKLEEEPPTNLIMCVPKKCVTKSEIKEKEFEYTPRGEKHFSCWNVSNHGFIFGNNYNDKPKHRRNEVYNITDSCVQSSRQADPNESAKSITLHI